jgi:3-phosphoshikimate 1-carboxyvinyltransferase
MRIEATCKSVSGDVNAPSSKSAMQRYVAGALLADGVSRINSASFCDDSRVAMAIAEALGAEISVAGNTVEIKGGFNPKENKIFCGESGLSTRMFTPIAALHSDEIVINGKGSILKRPLKMMELPLTELGVKISTNDGFLPIKIKGPIKGGDVYTDGSVSSQFITGLLMALPVVHENSVVIVDNLVSSPYVDLTIRILHEFGIHVQNSNNEKFIIPGRQKYKPGNFTVEGDWSGAAFLMIMAAMSGRATINNIAAHSAQADKAILEVITRCGADVSISDNSVTISKRDLHHFSFDISECPDLGPPVVVLALACKGKSIITGTGRLISKESDRGRILEATLSSLGGRIKKFDDRIEIEGGTSLRGGIADAHNDHRIAMALVTASLISDSRVIVEGMECINKSYPDFIDDFSKLGGTVKIL